MVSLAKWLSVRLRTKWLWVRISLLLFKLQIWHLLRARSFWTFRQTIEYGFTLKPVHDNNNTHNLACSTHYSHRNHTYTKNIEPNVESQKTSSVWWSSSTTTVLWLLLFWLFSLVLAQFPLDLLSTFNRFSVVKCFSSTCSFLASFPIVIFGYCFMTHLVFQQEIASFLYCFGKI